MGVAEMCPETCGTCPICVDSTSRMKFMYNGKKISRDCSWTRNKNPVGRCKIAGMENSCRKTCGNCVDS